MNLQSLPAYSGFPAGVDGQAYNEAAFRHFLAIERRRAEASMQSVLLVLVMIGRDAAGTSVRDATAAAIFRGLGESVREVDFVGWFREGRVAGAVLAQGTPASTEQARQLMADRVIRTLRKRLRPLLSKQLRVRVVHLLSESATERLNPSVARAVSG